MAKADDILTKALKATRIGHLTWNPVGRDSFRTQVGKLFLTVSKQDDVEFIFSIFDDDGNILESTTGYTGESQSTLYEIARRVALNIDDALHDLDQQLDELL